MKRLFAAVHIEPDQHFIRVYNGLKNALSAENIRWSPEVNLHVTLKFFGETHENIIPGICDALRHVHPGTPQFDLEISGTGMFGSRYKPRVIWLGLKGTQPLINMVNRLNEAIIPLGFLNDRQNFVPHLTAGRMNTIRDKAHFQAVLQQTTSVYMQTVSISSFHLYESILHKEGPEYRIIESFEF